SQDVSLKVFTIQPTVSWAITPRLSVGAGAMISWGTVNLNKGLVSAETFDKALPLLQQLDPRLSAVEPLGTTTPASVNLNGKSDVTVGLNVGALYKINDRVNVGASFRTRMAMKVDAGVASVKYANRGVEAALGETLNLIDQANFRAQMPCPWVLGLGVSWKPVDRLTLAFDGRLTGWHTYKQLNVEFLAEQLRDYDQHIPKHYRNSWCFSVGGQYAVTNRFDARLGLMVDTTPVDRNFYNPETPGMTKIEPTVGLSFRPIGNLSIDVAFMYVHGCGGKDTSCSYPDLMGKAVIGNLTKVYTLGAMGQGMPADQALLFGQNQAMQTAGAMGISTEGTFSARYTVRALIPSIGISYSF
ncbi:MAG: outer membrane protein transport protein, partial [Duncaniella sp.]|nr:outer membrane protein transport protein [Duncaniella sp.]